MGLSLLAFGMIRPIGTFWPSLQLFYLSHLFYVFSRGFSTGGSSGVSFFLSVPSRAGWCSACRSSCYYESLPPFSALSAHGGSLWSWKHFEGQFGLRSDWQHDLRRYASIGLTWCRGAYEQSLNCAYVLVKILWRPRTQMWCCCRSSCWILLKSQRCNARRCWTRSSGVRPSVRYWWTTHIAFLSICPKLNRTSSDIASFAACWVFVSLILNLRSTVVYSTS